jgi:F1F0 ATPase subunit 2
MTNTVIPYTVGALLLGAVAGTIYFAGLWLTVRSLTEGGRFTLRAAGSYILRLVLALSLFILAAWFTGEWYVPAVMLVGFTLVRVVMVRWKKRGPAGPAGRMEDGG